MASGIATRSLLSLSSFAVLSAGGKDFLLFYSPGSNISATSIGQMGLEMG